MDLRFKNALKYMNTLQHLFASVFSKLIFIVSEKLVCDSVKKKNEWKSFIFKKVTKVKSHKLCFHVVVEQI